MTSMFAFLTIPPSRFARHLPLHKGGYLHERFADGQGDLLYFSYLYERLSSRRMNCKDLIPISPLHLPAWVFRVSAAPENRVNDFLRL